MQQQKDEKGQQVNKEGSVTNQAQHTQKQVSSGLDQKVEGPKGKFYY